MANPTSPKDKEGQGGNWDKTHQAAHSAGEKAKEAAQTFGDKAKDVAHTVADKAKDAASAVGSMVSGAASSTATAVGKKADDWTSSAGGGVRSLGETIKEKGPHGGMLGSATKAVGDTLAEGGRYVEEEGLSGMMDDLSEVIRRNPMPAVLVGIGIGFLIGRVLGS